MSLQSSSSTSTTAIHTCPPSPPPSSYRLQNFFVASGPQPPLAPPPTALSLCSTLEFTYLGGSSSTSGMILPLVPEPGTLTGGDRRHRRMIKNRESAARSRARKQAYTYELELALVQLRRENAMLIKLHHQLNVCSWSSRFITVSPLICCC